jgi:hypothetical protein
MMDHLFCKDFLSLGLIVDDLYVRYEINLSQDDGLQVES